LQVFSPGVYHMGMFKVNVLMIVLD